MRCEAEGYEKKTVIVDAFFFFFLGECACDNYAAAWQKPHCQRAASAAFTPSSRHSKQKGTRHSILFFFFFCTLNKSNMVHGRPEIWHLQLTRSYTQNVDIFQWKNSIPLTTFLSSLCPCDTRRDAALEAVSAAAKKKKKEV